MNRSFAIGAVLALAAAVPITAFEAPSGGFTEGFDNVTPPALPAGWIASVNTGLASDIPWQTRTLGGTNVAWVNDVNDYADITLTSPTLTVEPFASPTVSFLQGFVLWAPDAGPLANGVYNGAVFEISVNGGPFTEFGAAGGAFTAGGYNATLDPNFDNPLAQTAPLNRPVWGGSLPFNTASFTTSGTMPAGSGGGTVQFRWRLGTEGGGRSFDTYSGWWLDDFACDCTGITVVDEIFKNGFDP